jgi:hypothetical protein
MSGVTTNDLAAASFVDDLVGNVAGTTVRITISDLMRLMPGQVSGPVCQTHAELAADLAWVESAVALVWGDDDELLRGLYRKSGAAGDGAWVRYAEPPVWAVAMAASHASAAAAADLYNGPAVDHSADLADVSADRLAVGQLVRVIETGDVYARAPDAAPDYDRAAGPFRLYAQPTPAEYIDRQFGVVADGDADDTAALARAAANIPPGKTLRLVGSGPRNISAPLAFAQARLRLVSEPGATIRQAPGTPTIDTLLTVSGDHAEVRGLEIDANNAGNQTATYTGRGELLKMAGARQVVSGLRIIGGHVKPYAAGLYITGDDIIVDGVTGYGSGRILVRGRADRPSIRNVAGFDIQASASHPDDTFNTGNKVLVWDGGSESDDPYTWLLFDNIAGHSADTGFQELIVVDQQDVLGGHIIARNLLANYPNSTGPDAIKFVNFARLDLDGLTTYHTGDGASNASLRLQHDDANGGRRTINLAHLDLAGHVNFDAATPADITISGGSQIGRDLDGPFNIDDLPPGTLTIDSGTQLRRFTSGNLASRVDAVFPDTQIGRCIIAGASTGTASTRQIATPRLEIITSQAARVRAGMLAIETPLSITNTRVPADGRWVFDADARDIAATLDGDFLWSGTDFSSSGPRDCTGWRRGMMAYRRDPSSGQIAALRCTAGGASCQTAWVGGSAYTVGAWRYNGSNVYVCTTAGTSASSGGPTGTGSNISDGTAVWDFVAQRAVWAADGQTYIGADSAANIASISAGINTTNKFAGKLAMDATNNRLMRADGSGAADPWRGGGVVVTPA